MEERQNRNDLVIATKYTTYSKNRAQGNYPGIGVNYCGNSKKNLKISLEESLKRLGTDYLDVLYVHWWYHSTSIPELMQSLDDVVRSGKVLYLGMSDTPAWIVAQANEYARQNCLAQFVVYKGMWNSSEREVERDIIPMCRNNGMSMAPWAVLGQGRFKSPEELKAKSLRAGVAEPSEKELHVCKVLPEVADEIGGGVHPAHIALAWARQKMADCFPILGGTSIEQLRSNIEALKLTLTDDQMKKLDEGSPVDHGYPTGRFGLHPRLLPGRQSQSMLLNTAGYIRYPGYPSP